jgi:hypothetical protein
MFLNVVQSECLGGFGTGLYTGITAGTIQNRYLERIAFASEFWSRCLECWKLVGKGGGRGFLFRRDKGSNGGVRADKNTLIALGARVGFIPNWNLFAERERTVRYDS